MRRGVQSLALGQLAGFGTLLFVLGLFRSGHAGAVPARPGPGPARASAARRSPAARAAALDPGTAAALLRVADEGPSKIVSVDAYLEGDDEPIHRRGAGVLASASGHVFAPLFVVANADSLIVNLGPDSRSPARVIGTDLRSCLAVLKLSYPPANLRFPRLCAGEAEQADAAVVLITMEPGKVRELPGTVMGMRDKVGPLTDVLEVSVHGTPGAMGGVLLNAKGELVGIALATTSAGAAEHETRVLVLPSSRIRAALGRILKGEPGADTPAERPVSVA
jgi:S1-C subfamily serine protease